MCNIPFILAGGSAQIFQHLYEIWVLLRRYEKIYSNPTKSRIFLLTYECASTFMCKKSESDDSQNYNCYNTKEPFVMMIVLVSDGDMLCKIQGFVTIY